MQRSFVSQTLLASVTFAAALLSGCAGAPDRACENLFDGTTLAGWTALGDASYTVEEGSIVGRAVYGVPNSFLRTDREFADFDLSLEFQVDAGFNSGIQFRSAVAADTMRWNHQAGNGDRFVQVSAPGRVYGYQSEIDPTDRAWTAEIYEEGARGWLETFVKQPAKRMIEPGRWHAVRIRAVGDSLKTWLDGAPVAALRDTVRSSGFVALQVHAVGTPEEAGKTVRFRGLQLCEPD